MHQRRNQRENKKYPETKMEAQNTKIYGIQQKQLEECLQYWITLRKKISIKKPNFTTSEKEQTKPKLRSKYRLENRSKKFFMKRWKWQT